MSALVSAKASSRLIVVAACLALSACSGARAFGSGALTPLDDLNLRRTEIPPVLIDASRDPYGARNMEQCGAIAWEVSALNEALGPDMDEPPLPDARDRSDRRSRAHTGPVNAAPDRAGH